MLCALSGEAPQEPVASKKSGNVFEKRLIQAYIAENHKDPVTGEELEPSDLITLQSPRAVKPRPPTLTSIPSLLSTFQNEWDAIMLETFTLKQTMHSLRQEISSLQYENDSAARVIARLLRERDESRDALSKMSVGQAKAAIPPITTNGDSSEAMQVDGAPPVLPDELVQEVESLQVSLSQSRRKRPVPDGWTPVDKIQNFNVQSRGNQLVPPNSHGFATDTSIDKGGKQVVIGGADGSGAIYNFPKDEVVRNLDFGDGQTNDCTCLDFATKLQFAVALSTGEVKIFDGDFPEGAFHDHAGSANALALHPGRRILASVGDDKTVVLYDVSKMAKLAQFATDHSLTTCKFHPDGVFLAVGSKAGTVSIFSFVRASKEHTFQFSGPIKSLAFSENGLWLAVAVEDSPNVEIVTLSKMTTIHQLDFGTPVNAIEWDYTGQYLAGGGSGAVAIHAYDKGTKTWSQPLAKALDVAALRWGPSGKGLLVLKMDGKVSLVR